MEDISPNNSMTVNECLLIFKLFRMEAMNDNQVVVGSNEQEEIDGNVDVNHSHGEEEEERIYAHKESNRITEEVSLRITPLVVLGFVCCMCTLLVLLYFFYDQLGKVSSIAFLMICENCAN